MLFSFGFINKAFKTFKNPCFLSPKHHNKSLVKWWNTPPPPIFYHLSLITTMCMHWVSCSQQLRGVFAPLSPIFMTSPSCSRMTNGSKKRINQYCYTFMSIPKLPAALEYFRSQWSKSVLKGLKWRGEGGGGCEIEWARWMGGHGLKRREVRKLLEERIVLEKRSDDWKKRESVLRQRVRRRRKTKLFPYS